MNWRLAVFILIPIILVVVSYYCANNHYKDRFRLFLKMAGQDKIFTALMKLASERGIGVSPMNLYRNLSCPNPPIMCADSLARRIIVSDIAVGEYIVGKNPEKEIIRLIFAHELGHLRKTYEEALELMHLIRNACKIERSCFWEEVTSTKTGVDILEKISGQIISQKILSAEFTRLSKQCRRCIPYLYGENQNCPKLNELKRVVVDFFR